MSVGRRRPIFGPKRTKIRPVSPLDIVRTTLLMEQGRFDRAHPLSRLGASSSIVGVAAQTARDGLPPGGRSCSWVLVRGLRVVGLAAVEQRSGPQSWEITQLFLRPGLEEYLPDLLESASHWAARRGGEKVFLRLLREDPLIDIARHGGFFPRIPEVLYSSTPALLRPSPGRGSENGQCHLVPKSSADEHGIFRTYNAATPPEVRYAVGMTFDQWRASHEPVRGRSRELVLRCQEHAKGWLRITRRARVGQMAVMVHPDREAELPEMVSTGLMGLRGARIIYAMVPEYQVALQRVLSEAGFEPVSDYVTLVKTMAIAAKEEVRAAAAAPSL